MLRKKLQSCYYCPKCKDLNVFQSNLGVIAPIAIDNNHIGLYRLSNLRRSYPHNYFHNHNLIAVVSIT